MNLEDFEQIDMSPGPLEIGWFFARSNACLL